MPDDRLALCLSGGGFRAALFHLGAVRRLNEVGCLSQVDTVSSVSGGSILAAHLATHVRPWPAPGTSFLDWQGKVEAPFFEFVRTNIRTGPLLQRFLLPWNWFRPSTQARALAAIYEKKLTSLMLPDLPELPRFIFCATDMYFGVSWVFEKSRVGSYQAGYLAPAPKWPVARAVAASSCFPPVFNPLPMEMEPGQKIVDGIGQPAKDWVGMSVNDGGLYDNLGLQPVEQHGTVLVSDGGQPFFPAFPKGVIGRFKAYLSIQGKQAGAIRRRQLIAEFQDKKKAGAYWGISSAVTSYRPGASVGYSKELATDTIAKVRTDMDAFSDGEIGVLMNHGYLLADIALAVHVPHLIRQSEELQVPFPELLDEGKAWDVLNESHVRKWLGRF